MKKLFTLSTALSSFLGLFILLMASTAQASVVPVCTASDGCAPDLNIGATGSAVTYTTNGTGAGGTLEITGLIGNISFHYSQVKDVNGVAFTAADDEAAGDQNHNFDGGLGFLVTGVGTAESFSLTLTVDSSGDITGGSINATGSVFDQIHGGFGNGGNQYDFAQTALGVVLDGTLLSGSFTGSQTGGIDFNTVNNRVDLGFIGGSVDAGSILAEYSSVFAGTAQLSSLGSSVTLDASNYLNNDWTASVSSMDVVVPVPAAITFFVPALIGLLGLKVKSNARENSLKV